MRTPNLRQVRIQDRFWKPRQNLVRDVMLPYQYAVMNDEVPGAEPSHALENFRIAAGLAQGEFYGMVFQDSDVYKWLEAAAYILAKEDHPELEKTADQVIDLIAAAQQPDGYLNTYFTVAEPEGRWRNLREEHELYCAGHLIEAAVAYYEATGKGKVLDVACRFADYISQIFGTEQGQKRGYPGHEGLELALVKLYRVTDNRKYLELSKYFVDERGRQPHYFEQEAIARGDRHVTTHGGRWDSRYNQSHLPVREQKEAVGHAVRAMYLYAALADLARYTRDESLHKICEALWEDVVNRKMYITGGIGSSSYGEAFTIPYDLPNDTSYTETCAAIGLVFWASRMLNLDPNGAYADVMETALYNGVLSGMALDGKSFFYVNPLEVWPAAAEHRYDQRHVKTTRRGWFRCACCPPNLARLLASLEQYIFSYHEDSIYLHLYMSSVLNIAGEADGISIEVATGYPWDGQVELTVDVAQPREFTLALRIPGWCQTPSATVNGEQLELAAIMDRGYAKVNRLWQSGDKITLDFPMPVIRLAAHPQVRENAGRVALQRGPLVYCLEEADNGPVLTDIVLPLEPEFQTTFDPELLGGVVTIEAEAYRSADDDQRLYRPFSAALRKVRIKAIPYYAWNNRGVGEMLVWIRQGYC
ncbi:MAG TPA: glycoside hydrolase family 127 protein [Limnochordia bacterium]|nr:glycoside hydrolase family 127 protein [Limnochordia bacterium]HPU66236.1 glycoside hydrolase family 127 protein [Limnochordia bacterium]